MDKKGQGISINVIIVAVIALVVLVVLVAIFTGRIAIFQRGVGDVNERLTSLKVQYGDCHPTLTQEIAFKAEFAKADSTAARQAVEDTLMAEINRCKFSSDKSGCEAAGCKWS